jgi:hypothetical protein
MAFLFGNDSKLDENLHPGVNLIYMSGYLDYDKGDGEFLEGVFPFRSRSHAGPWSTKFTKR